MLADLTFLSSAVLDSMIAFGIVLGLSKLTGRRKWRGAALLSLTIGLFIVAVFVTVLAGVALPFLARNHAESTLPALTSTALPDATAMVLTWLLERVALLGALVLIAIIVWRLWRDGAAFSWVVALLFAALLVLVALEIRALLAASGSIVTVGPPDFAARWAITWMLVIAVSGYIRALVVQHVGDVAIYVQPQALDRYNALRERIKKLVRNTAQAIYATRAGDGFVYDRVFWGGHSLGSVIAYDTLNRPLWEDRVSAKRLDVPGRTKLLLTFGSPLDKTAFFFATQRKHHGTTLREQFAATVQPLIHDGSEAPSPAAFFTAAMRSVRCPRKNVRWSLVATFAWPRIMR